MNTIDSGLALARITLNVSSATLNALAEALTSNNVPTEKLHAISQVLRDVSQSQTTAFEHLVTAERMNVERYANMQEQIRSLTHQLDFIQH